MASVPAAQAEVGRALQRARKRRRVSIPDAVESTRIPSSYLRALEDDASVERFPSPVYARFFLREYSQFLRLDPEPLIAGFDALHGPEERPALRAVPQLRPVPLLPSWRSRLAVAVAVIAAVAAGAAGFVASRPDGSGGVSSSDSTGLVGPEGSVADQDQATDPAPGGQGTPAFRGVRAVLEVRQRCWVKAVADGRTLVEQTVAPGRTVRLRAGHRLSLVLGNVEGVRLTVNGKVVRSRGRGGVARLTFLWRHGRLVPR